MYAIIALLALAGLGITAILANLVACQQDFSPGHAGTVTGISGMSMNVVAALANPLIGRYIDRTGHYTLIFVLMGVLPIVSLAGILAFDTLIHKGKRA